MYKMYSLLLVSFALLVNSCKSGTSNVRENERINNPLERHYQEGEKLKYRMNATNEDRHYVAEVTGEVKRDDRQLFFEDFVWSKLIVNESAIDLPTESMTVRQIVSLSPSFSMSIPNIAEVHPKLVGPILDLMNFYADLQLAGRQTRLQKAGDHVFIKFSQPSSWADGNNILIGEDCIDFDLTLTELNRSTNEATLLVRHLPPPNGCIQLPAEWMREPLFDSPNNWIQVEKSREGETSFIAAVGKEIFDVMIEVDLASGKIISASMDNPVDISERVCKDAALAQCGSPRQRRIFRKIELKLMELDRNQ